MRPLDGGLAEIGSSSDNRSEFAILSLVEDVMVINSIEFWCDARGFRALEEKMGDERINTVCRVSKLIQNVDKTIKYTILTRESW